MRVRIFDMIQIVVAVLAIVVLCKLFSGKNMLAFLLVAASVGVTTFWQLRRIRERRHWPGGPCIKCWLLPQPGDLECRNCGTARQASFKLDVGTVIAVVISGVLFLAGLVTKWWNLVIPSSLLCLGIARLWHLNRTFMKKRRGIGTLLNAGRYVFVFLGVLFSGWLIFAILK